MAQLYHKTFASDLSEFDFTTASSGTIERSASAGLNSTVGGVLYTVTGASPTIYGSVEHVLSALSAFRFAFFVDLTSLAIATNNDNAQFWSGRDSLGNKRIGLLRQIRLSGVQTLRSEMHRDTGGDVITDVTLTSQPAWIEVEVIRETTDTSNDGEYRVYAGGGDYPSTGQLIVEHTGVPNHAMFVNADRSRLGIMFGGTSVTGSMKVDEVIARDDNTPILFGVSESVISRGMKYVLNRRRRKLYCW